jgi:hypothetical protein
VPEFARTDPVFVNSLFLERWRLESVFLFSQNGKSFLIWDWYALFMG